MGDVQELLLTPVYEQVEGGWTQAHLRELPGVITVAPTHEQAQDMLVDALREFLLSFRSDDVGLEPDHPEGAITVTIGVRPPAA